MLMSSALPNIKSRDREFTLLNFICLTSPFFLVSVWNVKLLSNISVFRVKIIHIHHGYPEDRAILIWTRSSRWKLP